MTSKTEPGKVARTVIELFYLAMIATGIFCMVIFGTMGTFNIVCGFSGTNLPERLGLCFEKDK